MKLSELIVAIGDENIVLQNLFECLTASKQVKRGGTELSFLTDQVNTTEIATDRFKKIGLVVWLPKDKLPEF